jgi:hypothetical protein
MQIKLRQQAVKGVRIPFDPIAWEGRVRASLQEARVCLSQREKPVFCVEDWGTNLGWEPCSQGLSLIKPVCALSLC